MGTEELPDTLARRMGWFLNRWHWRGNRAVVEGELLELIEWATQHVVSGSEQDAIACPADGQAVSPRATDLLSDL